jgi:hypothetical protein
VSPNPEPFLSHLQSSGYHPRSDRHSNALAQAIVDDLVAYCPRIRQKAAAGELVYDLNFTLKAGRTDWNVDLVLGVPEIGTVAPPADILIARRLPSSVQIAIEIKAVMTEHHKAVKNRKRDLEAHHEHVHNYNNSAIAGGVLVVNSAPTFRSPLRNAVTIHKNPDALAAHRINELRGVASRGGSTGYGLEAKCAIVVDMDNQKPGSARYASAPPNPTVGDPLYYDAFIQSICEHYTRRF